MHRNNNSNIEEKIKTIENQWEKNGLFYFIKAIENV